jgi:hypothetical protein
MNPNAPAVDMSERFSASSNSANTKKNTENAARKAGAVTHHGKRDQFDPGGVPSLSCEETRSLKVPSLSGSAVTERVSGSVDGALATDRRAFLTLGGRTAPHLRQTTTPIDVGFGKLHSVRSVTVTPYQSLTISPIRDTPYPRPANNATYGRLKSDPRPHILPVMGGLPCRGVKV